MEELAARRTMNCLLLSIEGKFNVKVFFADESLRKNVSSGDINYEQSRRNKMKIVFIFSEIVRRIIKSTSLQST